jgi:hypothetical protein
MRKGEAPHELLLDFLRAHLIQQTSRSWQNDGKQTATQIQRLRKIHQKLQLQDVPRRDKEDHFVPPQETSCSTSNDLTLDYVWFAGLCEDSIPEALGVLLARVSDMAGILLGFIRCVRILSRLRLCAFGGALQYKSCSTFRGSEAGTLTCQFFSWRTTLHGGTSRSLVLSERAAKGVARARGFNVLGVHAENLQRIRYPCRVCDATL